MRTLGSGPPVIEVDNLTQVYRLPTHDASSIKELAVRVFRRRPRASSLIALNNVSFTVERGEVFAILGPNGAGKSTLMKLLARVLPPSAGRVIVRGHVSPMIELGAGFNIEQTARENIVLYGTLLGRSIRHMRSRCWAIAEWAGLEEYLDVPIRAFSSGMVARLAFSVATDVKPEVLLIDEVLSVGDAAFQKKSSERMEELIAGGTSVVLVTHSMDVVRERAERAMLLDRGNVQMVGSAKEVVAYYERLVGL